MRQSGKDERPLQCRMKSVDKRVLREDGGGVGDAGSG